MALSRAMRAILNPPSRTTFARHEYVSFVRSSFSPRERQQYLKALQLTSISTLPAETKDKSLLEVAHFTQERARRDDAESDPESPHKSTENGNDFMAE